MKTIGKKGERCKFSAYVEGSGGRLEISAASCNFAVGSIPMCKIFVPPEMLAKVPDEETDDIYKLIVDDGNGKSTLFTGYFSGDNGKITGNSIAAGFDLIHLARDLDSTRISAPSLHPSSAIDYTYTWSGAATSGGAASSGYTFAKDPSFYKKGKGRVPEQIIKALVSHLSGIQRSSSSTNGANVRIDSMQKGIDLLNKIKFQDGKLQGKLEAPLSTDEDTSLNTWARNKAIGSFSGMRSVWDTLTSIFSDLGIYLVCDNEGDVTAMVDCSGMSTDANKLDGSFLTDFEKSSSMFRNVGEVLIISDNVRNQSTSGGGGSSGGAGAFVSYPQSGADKGATLILQIPGWLNPIAETTGDLLSVQRQYARMIYTLERNKFSTISVAGPLAPLVVPGTICNVTPYSAIKARSGGSLEDFKRTYVGYCHQISHSLDVKGGTCQTTFLLKNVSIEGKGAKIQTHPLFDDVKPFTWK
jgi:hypothetical protein